jgi:hypothetical protein
MRWKLRLRRFAPNISKVLQRKMRLNFIFAAVSKHDTM